MYILSYKFFFTFFCRFIDIQPQNKNPVSQQKVEESAEDLRRIRRQRSRQNLEPALPLQQLVSIKEEDKLKSISPEIKKEKSYSSKTWAERHGENTNRNTPEKPIHNKIEIDSDNIETPPVTRRVFNPPSEVREPCRRFQTSLNKQNNNDADHTIKNIADDLRNLEPLGDGQFDRFSAARRTRRYKRPTDYSSQSEDASPKSDSKQSEAVSETLIVRPSHLDLSVSQSVGNTQVSPQIVKTDDEKDSRLRKWQERLQRQDSSGQDKEEPIPVAKTTAKSQWTPRLRHQTSINQEDVQKAIRELKSPTENPRHISIPRTQISSNKPLTVSKNTSETQSKLHSKNRSEHELNDEGFEETQSLNSESASQGASSGCNEPDVPDTRQKTTKSLRTSSNISDTNRLRPNNTTRSLRGITTGTKTMEKRALSLRKADSQSSVGSLRSRGSLRSSRSSLNSSTSVATVRRVPPPPPSRPRIPPSGSSRVAASRSSSSGSSVAQKITRPIPPASRSSSSGSSSVPPRPPSSFMRPTQSSRTKVQRTPSRTSAVVK